MARQHPVCRSGDLVRDTAALLGLRDERVLFRQAAEAKGFSNALEVANYRFERWLKYGEISPVIEEYCLGKWRSNACEPTPVDSAVS